MKDKDIISMHEFQEEYIRMSKAGLNPPILDACCGGKMFYFDKNNTDVLYQDIRDVDMVLCDGRKFSIHPDVVADFRNMPYKDNTFRMVVFDPPHLKRNIKNCSFNDIYSEKGKCKPKGWQEKKYGSLGNVDWRDTIRRGFSECFRVLKPGGFLIFKWNETDIKTSEVLKLTTEKPIFGIKFGRREKSHFIVFMKHPTTSEKMIMEETDTIMASELARKLNAAVEANGDLPVINSLTMPVPAGDGFSYVVYHKGDDHFELE